MDFRVAVFDDAMGERFVIDAGDALEDVREGAVAEIVQERRGDADRFRHRLRLMVTESRELLRGSCARFP